MNSAVRWLYRVLGRKKGYIVALTAVQAVSGALGVVYALLLREIVDSAVGHDAAGFWRNVVLILLLVLVQLSLAALLRWLRELANSALDEATERQLLDRLRAMTDRTVLIVTHRRAALGICDRVLRFGEDGVCEAE